MQVHNAYLLAYNAVQFCLWSQVLFRAMATGLSKIGSSSVQSLAGSIYDASIFHAEMGQTLAWLEVVHAMVGLVGGGVTTSFIQCLGRYVVLVYVVLPIEFIHNAWVTVIMILTWAVADVIRYLFYIQGLMGQPSSVLLWLRYSLFIILYPIGVAAEWLIFFFTLDYVDKMQLYAVKMPNVWNFSFDFGVWNRIVLVIYFYFGPFMYMHMLRQRKKKLHTARTSP